MVRDSSFPFHNLVVYKIIKLDVANHLISFKSLA